MQPLSIDLNLLWHDFAKLAAVFVLALPTGLWGEREGHAVGVRTFPIVAMASCGYLMILQSTPGADSFTASSRVLQGLVAGIGFVGGGAIVKDGPNVHGTATAASIWNTGAIGAAAAMNHWEIAIVLAVMNVFIMAALVPLKKRLDRDNLR
jgi:putative Mg2+ transporter-C (MgtC) family protein